MFQKLKFKEANDKQLEAIKSIDGPLLIVAGPGTGKTYTLINRALNLIVNYGVSPSSILFATFTEKAANELITRLSVELAKYNIDFNPDDMYIGTFHSICLKIIKDNVSLSTLKKTLNCMTSLINNTLFTDILVISKVYRNLIFILRMVATGISALR